MDDLVERLRKVVSNRPDSIGISTSWNRNPDGPEAADTITALREALRVAVDAATAWQDGGDIEAIQAFEEWLPQARAALASIGKE